MKAIDYVVKEFQRVYKAKDENAEYVEGIEFADCQIAENATEIYGYVYR